MSSPAPSPPPHTAADMPQNAISRQTYEAVSESSHQSVTPMHPNPSLPLDYEPSNGLVDFNEDLQWIPNDVHGEDDWGIDQAYLTVPPIQEGSKRKRPTSKSDSLWAFGEHEGEDAFAPEHKRAKYSSTSMETNVFVTPQKKSSKSYVPSPMVSPELGSPSLFLATTPERPSISMVTIQCFKEIILISQSFLRGQHSLHFGLFRTHLDLLESPGSPATSWEPQIHSTHLLKPSRCTPLLQTIALLPSNHLPTLFP
jgi:hypothetical protein